MLIQVSNAKQIALPIKQNNWGGKRKGGGRKPHGKRAGVSRRRRPDFDHRHPIHVTVRVKEDVANLRTKERVKVVRDAMRAAGDRFGFRVVHFSVLRNHIHMMAEADGKKSLSRGMQGLLIRMALRLNKILGRKGSVFSDRYHAHVLKTPTEARNALAYVLLNARRHAAQAGRRLARNWLDPYSSGRWFEGFVSAGGRPLRSLEPASESPLQGARHWLLQVGWRRGGTIPINAVRG